MQYLLFLAISSVLQLTTANPLSGDEGDVNLFLDSNVNLLPPDDSNLWVTPSEDPILDQLSLDDVSPDDALDWTDSVELAGVDDFCAADEEFQISARIRARDGGGSCKTSDHNTNLLTWPHDLFGKPKNSDVSPAQAPVDTRPSAPAAIPLEEQCVYPFPEHLCCVEPLFGSRTATTTGPVIYGVMVSCAPGKRPCFHPSRSASNKRIYNSSYIWILSITRRSLLRLIFCMGGKITPLFIPQMI